MGVVRHIEIEFNDFDLTGWGESLEDFASDTPRDIYESVLDYLQDNSAELFDKIRIKKVWYEREEIQNEVDEIRY